MQLTVVKHGEALAAMSGVQLETVASLTPGVTTCTNSTTSTCASTIVAAAV